ncbi:MAG: hypothetical protein WC304_04490 [Candidatus Gracilibacteria bacterium]|jgi:hypothetical protein
MNLTKKLSLLLAVLVVIGGGGVFANSLLGKPSNPETIVKAALGNAFAETTKHTETTANLVTSAGKAEFALMGDIAEADKLLPTADYRLAISGSLPLGDVAAQVSGNLNFRIVDEDIYLQVVNPTLTGSGEKITAIQTYLNDIAGKWLALPLNKLAAENTAVAQKIVEKNAAQQNLRAKLQTILSNNTAFEVKKASGNFLTGKYYITVTPKLGEFLTDDMVNNLGKLLGFTTAEETTQLKAQLTAMQPEITLTISRSGNEFLGYATTLQTGETILTIENTVKKLSENPSITPPETSEVFDAESYEAAFGG